MDGTSFEVDVPGRNIRIENMKKKNIRFSRDLLLER